MCVSKTVNLYFRIVLWVNFERGKRQWLVKWYDLRRIMSLTLMRDVLWKQKHLRMSGKIFITKETGKRKGVVFFLALLFILFLKENLFPRLFFYKKRIATYRIWSRTCATWCRRLLAPPRCRRTCRTCRTWLLRVLRKACFLGGRFSVWGEGLCHRTKDGERRGIVRRSKKRRRDESGGCRMKWSRGNEEGKTWHCGNDGTDFLPPPNTNYLPPPSRCSTEARQKTACTRTLYLKWY